MRAILFLLLVGIPLRALAWGGRAHTLICEASVYLVKTEALAEVLRDQSYKYAQLCLVPDTIWPYLNIDTTEGNYAHYFNGLDVVSTKGPINESFQGVLEQMGDKPPWKMHASVGSSWWRARQFYELTVMAGKNRSLREFIINAAFMGHFVADISIGLHSVKDWDGRAQGHSGLHEFYEHKVVSMLNERLLHDVLEYARGELLRKQEYLKPIPFLERMRALAVLSARDVKSILVFDRVTKKSSSDVAALRRVTGISPEFKRIVVQELGRAVALQTVLLEEAFLEAGSPKFERNDFRFPQELPFTPPNYLP